MAKYRITGPDGASYEVNAPDTANQEEVMAFAKQHVENSGPKPNVSALESGARGAVQGVTFGFGDEIYGGVKGAYDTVTGEGNFTDNYARNRDEVRLANDRAAEANPGAYLGGEIVGGVALPFGAARAGLKGVQAANSGLKARSVAAAKEGAGYGAAYGLGNAEGDFGEQLASTVGGAATGGVIGGALPSAIAGASAVARAPAQAVRVLTRPKEVAAEKVSQAFARDAGEEIVTAGPINAAAQRLDDAGNSRMMLFDQGGENVRNLARVATNSPNAAVEPLQRTLNRRQALQGRDLTGVLQATLADGKEFTAVADDLIKSRAANAEPAFRQAYAAPIPKGSPADADIAQFFERRKYMDRLLSKTIETIQGVSGKSVREMRPWELLHRVKMEINREVGRLKRGQQDSVASWTVSDLTKLNQEYGQLLSRHNGGLGRALRQYSDESGLINAIEEGSEEFFKMSPEELAKKVRTLPKDEAELYRVGASRAVIEKLRAGDVMRDKTKSVFGSEDMGLKLKAVYPEGTPGRGEFMKAIGEARRMAMTRRAVQGNSTTAKQLIQAQEGGKGIQTAANVANAARGNVSSIVSLLERGQNYATGITPEVAQEIIRLGMTKGSGQLGTSQTQAIQDASRRLLARGQRQNQATNALLPVPGVLYGEGVSSDQR